jgi:hypothetical protein
MSHASLLCVVRTVLASGTALGDLACDDRRVFPNSNEQRGLPFAKEVDAAEVELVVSTSV